MSTKQRLSASVDADLIAAAADAVDRRRVVSVSAWVNDALRLKLAHDRRLDALAAFVAGYEREYGRITPEEMEQAARRGRARATPVHGAKATTPSRLRRKRSVE